MKNLEDYESTEIRVRSFTFDKEMSIYRYYQLLTPGTIQSNALGSRLPIANHVQNLYIKGINAIDSLQEEEALFLANFLVHFTRLRCLDLADLDFGRFGPVWGPMAIKIELERMFSLPTLRHFGLFDIQGRLPDLLTSLPSCLRSLTFIKYTIESSVETPPNATGGLIHNTRNMSVDELVMIDCSIYATIFLLNATAGCAVKSLILGDFGCSRFSVKRRNVGEKK